MSPRFTFPLGETEIWSKIRLHAAINDRILYGNDAQVNTFPNSLNLHINGGAGGFQTLSTTFRGLIASGAITGTPYDPIWLYLTTQGGDQHGPQTPENTPAGVTFELEQKVSSGGTSLDIQTFYLDGQDFQQWTVSLDPAAHWIDCWVTKDPGGNTRFNSYVEIYGVPSPPLLGTARIDFGLTVAAVLRTIFGRGARSFGRVIG
jgi:hypothetical protein